MKNYRAPAVTSVLRLLSCVGCWLLTGLTVVGAAAPAIPNIPTISAVDAGSAAAMRERHVALARQLASNSYQRPLVIESTQTSKDVKGDIYSVVPHPYAAVSAALAGPRSWCDILILHLNTKYCKTNQGPAGTTLLLNVGKKFDQPLADSYRLTFVWQLVDQKADYLRVIMSADEGPFSTHDYRITVEAVPLEDGKTFLHLSYSYGFGFAGNIAMLAYFKTIGHNKVGFTVVGDDKDGKPAFVDGMRGLVERNTMRYHLAIEAFLGALAVQPPARFEKRINDWFVAAERYPRQLHEMEFTDYLAMKRNENLRQQPD